VPVKWLSFVNKNCRLTSLLKTSGSGPDRFMPLMSLREKNDELSESAFESVTHLTVIPCGALEGGKNCCVKRRKNAAHPSTLLSSILLLLRYILIFCLLLGSSSMYDDGMRPPETRCSLSSRRRRGSRQTCGQKKSPMVLCVHSVSLRSSFATTKTRKACCSASTRLSLISSLS
jgi:hypothetical protein